jgi:hypothetical protein
MKNLIKHICLGIGITMIAASIDLEVGTGQTIMVIIGYCLIGVPIHFPKVSK